MCWLGGKVAAWRLRFSLSANIGAAILKFMQSEKGTILQSLYLYQAGEIPVHDQNDLGASKARASVQ